MIPHKANQLLNSSLRKNDVWICYNETIIIEILLYIADSDIVTKSIAAIKARTNDPNLFRLHLTERSERVIGRHIIYDHNCMKYIVIPYMRYKFRCCIRIIVIEDDAANRPNLNHRFRQSFSSLAINL